MTDNIKISVIMPSLNVEDYIEQCISSVIKQTLNEIEIICVDAGSTDNTLNILKKYAEKDSRIRIIHSDKKSYMNNIFQKNNITICSMYPNRFKENGLIS